MIMPMKDIPGPLEYKQIHSEEALLNSVTSEMRAQEIRAEFWMVEWISPIHNGI